MSIVTSIAADRTQHRIRLCQHPGGLHVCRWPPRNSPAQFWTSAPHMWQKTRASAYCVIAREYLQPFSLVGVFDAREENHLEPGDGAGEGAGGLARGPTRFSRVLGGRPPVDACSRLSICVGRFTHRRIYSRPDRRPASRRRSVLSIAAPLGGPRSSARASRSRAVTSPPSGAASTIRNAFRSLMASARDSCRCAKSRCSVASRACGSRGHVRRLQASPGVSQAALA